MGITVGGWVFSLELRERPSPEATYGDNSTTKDCYLMNVSVPVPFWGHYCCDILVLVVL